MSKGFCGVGTNSRELMLLMRFIGNASTFPLEATSPTLDMLADEVWLSRFECTNGGAAY